MSVTHVSRRQLFAGAVASWVSSLSPRERVATQREVGSLKRDLDTPALCVDLDRLERNLTTLKNVATGHGIGVRPHGKTHRCPEIARLQIAHGALGICAAKVSEAEAMFEHGVGEILLTSASVTPTKMRRAMTLRQRCPALIQATDSEENARRLDDVADEADVVADVILHLDSGGHRGGVLPGRDALELGRLVGRLSHLRLRGIYCYDGRSQHVNGFEERRRQTLERMAPAADTFAMMQRDGLEVDIFSGGGTGTYNIDHEVPGFTETQAGSYVFMDAQYQAIGGIGNDHSFDDFLPALTVVTTVVHVHPDTLAMTDAGANACTRQSPVIVTEPGLDYSSRSDEAGLMIYGDSAPDYHVGDRLELLPANCDPVVNLFDRMYATRGDRVERVWSIAARGKSQ